MPRFWLIIVLILLNILWPILAHGAPPPIAPAFSVRDQAAPPQTDGTFTVWAEPDPDTGNTTFAIYARRRGSDARITVDTGLPDPAQGRGFPPSPPVIDQGIVVWVAGSGPARTLRATNLHTHETTTLASGAISHPAINGSLVTWWEDVDPTRAQRPDPLPATLRLRDLRTMADPVAITRTPNTIYPFGPALMSQDWLVWAQATGNVRHGALTWEMSAVDLRSGARQDLGTITSAAEPWLDVVGERAFVHRMEIAADYSASQSFLVEIDLRSGTRRESGPHGLIASLSAEERFVFWGKLHIVRGAGLYDLWGYDRQTRSAFMVAGGASMSKIDPKPHIHNGVLVWRWQDERGTMMAVAPIADVLPSARRAGEPAAGDQQFFAESGHSLGGEFLRFWAQSGGLPVFGYPLTDEFMEQNASSAAGHATQYVERQRFELHPQNAGTPYLVLLGRLGADLLAAQGRAWEGLPKADPRLPHYFNETGHAIAPQFWDYWRSHGLEFGDAGVSGREALALFGYPISEPQLERNSSGDEVLTQWFERARFEYHPANPPAARVLLGRLGAELLRLRGW